MEKQDLLIQYNDDLINELNSLNEDNPFGKYIVNEIGKGKNSVVSKILQESKVFDATWIDTLESYFPSLDRIIRNPRSSIKNEYEVVAAERAKKVTSESIRHLAAHTEYIREVNQKTEEVTPSKILTTYREQDMGIYENRFIKTLINRLYFFVTKRYEVVKNDYKSYTRNILEYDSNFNLESSTVNCKIQLDIKSGQGNEKINEKNEDLVRRIENLAGLISGYRVSPFMREMEKEKEVLPPIMKTNIILKNPDFRNCYLLWLFIDRYTSIGYDVSTRQKSLEVNDEYQEQLVNLAMITYVTNEAYNPDRDLSYDTPDFKEKLLKRLKQKQNGELDVNLKPDNIRLENTLITEAFLLEASKMFNKAMDDQIKNGEETSVALKKTIEQMLHVVNSVYKSMFEIPEETKDVFQQLMETSKKSDEAFVKEYKQKIRILKDVISVKEKDLKQTKREKLKMEKNLERHLANIEKQKKKEQARIEALAAKEKARQEALAAKEKARQEALAAKEKARQEALAAKEKAKQEALAEKEKEKARIALEKQKEKERLQKEKEKEKLALQKQREKERARLAAKKAKEKERAKLKAQKEREKEKERLALEKQKEKERLALEKQKAKEEALRLKELEKQKLLEEKKKQEEAEKARIAKEKEAARLLLLAQREKEKEEERKKKELELELKRKQEEELKLKLEQERRQKELDESLQSLVKFTKKIAAETETVAKQAEDIVGVKEEKKEEKPSNKDTADLDIEGIKEIASITKQIADDTHNISSQVGDIVDDVLDGSKGE